MREFAVVVAITCLSACGGQSGYSDLLDLRDAAVDAGLSCSDWNRKEAKPDSESGTCSDQTVVILYDDPNAKERGLREMSSLMDDMGISYTFLVGDNWVINSPDAGDLQDDMGGKVVTSP